MRKQIIKILQKQDYQQQQHRLDRCQQHTDSSGQLQNKIDYNSSMFHLLSTREQMEFDKIKYCIETAGTRQTQQLLTKVKAVERVTPSAQKRKQQRSIQKRIEQQQSSPKLTASTDSNRNCHQHRKKEQEALIQTDNKQEQKQDKQYQELLEMQIELLAQQLNQVKHEKEQLNKQNISLKLENGRLRASLVQKDAEIINLGTDNQNIQFKADSVRFQLQTQFQKLASQNEVLKKEKEKVTKTKLSNNMALCSPTLRLAVVAHSTPKIDNKSRDVKLQLLNIQKKYASTISQLKAQHEEEITRLRKTLFDNINFYRDQTKKTTHANSNDKHRELQPQPAAHQSTMPLSLLSSANSQCGQFEQNVGK